ncbi:MAG: NAD(P)/FAD-dependent oxidoreductase [Phycisphaerae bacterium]
MQNDSQCSTDNTDAAPATQDQYDVVVIGAGHNGLTAAAMLAKNGRRLLVVERRDIVGGLAAGEEFHPGFKTSGLLHDTSGVREDVLQALDLERFGLRLNSEPPAIFAPQEPGQGTGLLLSHDPDTAASEITELSADDAERYADYRGFLGRIRGFVGGLLRDPPPDLSTNGWAGLLPLAHRGWALRRLGKKDMMELLRIAPMCVADWLGEWFESELLKSLLAGPAVYGTFAGPRSPGSNANLLRAEVLAGQAVKGGPRSLIDALAAAARDNGVEIRTGAEVRDIRISDGRVNGVILADGESIDAAIVVASCDPKRTFLQMVNSRVVSVSFVHRIKNLRMRGTTAKVNLALNKPLRFACRPDLEVEYARTGKSLKEMERSFDAVKYGRFSSTLILDIHVPSVRTPALAPPGHSVVSILAHFVPYSIKGGWNDRLRVQLGDTIVDALSRYAPEVRSAIVGCEVLSPADLEQRYGLTGGHIHHGEHGLDQLLVRPCPECARYGTPIAGLYLCGSGSHPGGGLTCAPGANAASVIINRRPGS